jgi:UDP-2,3-diacylglucosamine pyrophosphatase LpxH
MVRDFDALEQSKQKHNEWQYLSFFNTRTKFIRESLDYRIRAEKEKDIEKKKESMEIVGEE